MNNSTALNNFDLFVELEKAKIAEKESKAYRLEVQQKMVDVGLAHFVPTDVTRIDTKKVRQHLAKTIHLYEKKTVELRWKLMPTMKALENL